MGATVAKYYMSIIPVPGAIKAKPPFPMGINTHSNTNTLADRVPESCLSRFMRFMLFYIAYILYVRTMKTTYNSLVCVIVAFCIEYVRLSRNQSSQTARTKPIPFRVGRVGVALVPHYCIFVWGMLACGCQTFHVRLARRLVDGAWGHKFVTRFVWHRTPPPPTNDLIVQSCTT